MRAGTCVIHTSNHACLCSYLCLVRPRVHTDTFWIPLQPRQAIAAWCLCTSVPLSSTGRSRCLVIPVYSIVLSPPYLADPWPR